MSEEFNLWIVFVISILGILFCIWAYNHPPKFIERLDKKMIEEKE